MLWTPGIEVAGSPPNPAAQYSMDRIDARKRSRLLQQERDENGNKTHRVMI